MLTGGPSYGPYHSLQSTPCRDLQQQLGRADCVYRSQRSKVLHHSKSGCIIPLEEHLRCWWQWRAGNRHRARCAVAQRPAQETRRVSPFLLKFLWKRVATAQSQGIESVSACVASFRCRSEGAQWWSARAEQAALPACWTALHHQTRPMGGIAHPTHVQIETQTSPDNTLYSHQETYD